MKWFIPNKYLIFNSDIAFWQSILIKYFLYLYLHVCILPIAFCIWYHFPSSGFLTVFIFPSSKIRSFLSLICQVPSSFPFFMLYRVWLPKCLKIRLANILLIDKNVFSVYHIGQWFKKPNVFIILYFIFFFRNALTTFRTIGVEVSPRPFAPNIKHSVFSFAPKPQASLP